MSSSFNLTQFDWGKVENIGASGHAIVTAGSVDCGAVFDDRNRAQLFGKAVLNLTGAIHASKKVARRLDPGEILDAMEIVLHDAKAVGDGFFERVAGHVHNLAAESDLTRVQKAAYLKIFKSFGIPDAETLKTTRGSVASQFLLGTPSQSQTGLKQAWTM